MTLPVAPGPKASAHDLGVPSPYSVHVHPWPTRFHGALYARPAFSYPYVVAPQSVFKPDDFVATGPGTGVRRIPGVPNSAYDRYPWPLNGLGAQSLGMTVDTHRGIFGAPGQGSGIFGASAAHGLGEDKPVTELYPWREYSAATAALQTNTNKLLKEAGYCPIGVDGKMGPGTCAALEVVRKAKGLAPPSGVVCPEMGSPPRKPPCGGGGVLPTTPATPASPSEAAAATTFMPSRFPTKAVAFAVGGVAALGFVALYAKKKGLF